MSSPSSSPVEGRLPRNGGCGEKRLIPGRHAGVTALLAILSVLYGCAGSTKGAELRVTGRLPVKAAASADRPQETRTVRVAIVQMASRNGRVKENLDRAAVLVAEAAAGGARLVLLPELFPTGYSFSFDLWDAAEPSDGQTVRWLRESSARLKIWLGTSFLEADGEDFFNTFVLASPDGTEAGRVRKQLPASVEAFLFRGEKGSHVIRTKLGTIGVGICYENYLSFFADEMSRETPDLILMPHSAPNGPGETEATALIAAWYASRLGIPVAMVNRVGSWDTRVLGQDAEYHGYFPGKSGIADSDGSMKTFLGGDEAVGIADVTLDPRRKTRNHLPVDGRWIELVKGGLFSWIPGKVAASLPPPYTSGSATQLPFQVVEDIGTRRYLESRERKAKALAVSSGVVLLGTLGALACWVGYMASPTKGRRIAVSAQPRKALVVVDMEEDCVGATAHSPFPYENAQQMIDVINPLIAQAEQQGTPVVFVNQTFAGVAGTLWSKVFVGGRLMEGAPGTHVDRRLSTGNHPQLTKPKGDAFSNPALDAYLIENHVDAVVIVGVDAEFCVHLTAQGALNRGYKVAFVKDAIGLMNDDKWSSLLATFAKEGIQVLESRDFKL